MLKDKIKEMSMEEIRQEFRGAALLEEAHQEISWERGARLVTILAVHGQRIADRLTN